MKAKLHKLIGTTMLALCLFSNEHSAWAGAASLPQVFVSSDSASGTMAGARYSADNQQYIGCQFWNNGGPSVTCAARDSTGKTFFCYSFQSQHAAAVKGITDSSRIGFGSPAGNNGACGHVYVENYSDFLR